MNISRERSFNPGVDIDELGLQRLTARLPASALESLALEVLSRMSSASNEAVAPTVAISPIRDDSEIDGFCDTQVSLDPRKSRDHVEALRADGADFSSLYLGLFTPAARRLGQRWEEDIASFAEVSMGIGRIYSILHELRDLQPISARIARKHAIFATLPGEEHTLGATIATDLFRDRGWDVDLLVGMDHEDLVTAIEGSAAPVLGVSAASADDVTPLLRLVMALHVRRPALRIFVAGHIVAECPDISEFDGVDGASAEFEAAYTGIESLFAKAVRRGSGPI